MISNKIDRRDISRGSSLLARGYQFPKSPMDDLLHKVFDGLAREFYAKSILPMVKYHDLLGEIFVKAVGEYVKDLEAHHEVIR